MPQKVLTYSLTVAKYHLDKFCHQNWPKPSKQVNANVFLIEIRNNSNYPFL